MRKNGLSNLHGIAQTGVDFSAKLTITGLWSHLIQTLCINFPQKNSERPKAIIHQTLFNKRENEFCINVHICQIIQIKWNKSYLSVQWRFGSEKYRTPWTVLFVKNSPSTAQAAWEKEQLKLLDFRIFCLYRENLNKASAPQL